MLIAETHSMGAYLQCDVLAAVWRVIAIKMAMVVTLICSKTLSNAAANPICTVLIAKMPLTMVIITPIGPRRRPSNTRRSVSRWRNHCRAILVRLIVRLLAHRMTK